MVKARSHVSNKDSMTLYDLHLQATGTPCIHFSPFLAIGRNKIIRHN